jgi:hypothetical protein
MGIGDRIGGKHGTRLNTTVYVKSDQGLCNSATAECQCHHIQRTCSRSERNPFSPNGST